MADPAWCVVVAGVSGSGKSTTAARIAALTGARLADGDDLHSPEAIARMRAGVPLDDADRAPWLERIGAWIDEQHASGSAAVISCSALRRAHREVLATHRPWVRFCLLAVPTATVATRLAGRTDHFMPAQLLPSQLALLEPLAPDEHGATVDAVLPPDEVALAALRSLGLVDTGESVRPGDR